MNKFKGPIEVEKTKFTPQIQTQ